MPKKTSEMPQMTAAELQRFLANIDKSPGYGPTGDCWQWTASRSDSGYGTFWIGDKTRSAHRIAFTVFNGRIPSGMYVLHTCDNKGCVRPDHLWTGTNKDNVHDMIKKGRNPKGETHGSRTCPGRLPRGEQNCNAKLTAKDIVEIREKYAAGGYTHVSLAAKYGVVCATITFIVNRKTWKHIA